MMVFPYTIIDCVDGRIAYTLEGAYVHNRIENTYYMHKFIKMKDGAPVYEIETKPCSEYAFRKAIRKINLEKKLTKERMKKEM